MIHEECSVRVDGFKEEDVPVGLNQIEKHKGTVNDEGDRMSVLYCAGMGTNIICGVGNWKR